MNSVKHKNIKKLKILINSQLSVLDYSHSKDLYIEQGPSTIIDRDRHDRDRQNRSKSSQWSIDQMIESIKSEYDRSIIRPSIKFFKNWSIDRRSSIKKLEIDRDRAIICRSLIARSLIARSKFWIWSTDQSIIRSFFQILIVTINDRATNWSFDHWSLDHFSNIWSTFW